MPRFLPSLPWWAWALLGLGAFTGSFIGWMWLMSHLVRNGADLGIPDRVPMPSDGSLFGADERRPS